MIDSTGYDQARDYIATEGFTAELQTKIAFFINAVKTGNVAYHSWVQWLVGLNVAQQQALSQYSRELEAISLLVRTARWSSDPMLFMRGQQIVAPLASAWSQILFAPFGPMLNQDAAYRGMALGHAQLARVRLAPIIPDSADALDPFVVVLRRVEQENARMLQLQIRMLKHMNQEFPVASRETEVEGYQRLVDEVFGAFLSWMTER
ncbi:MAG: hypothetical protein VBE63_07035 [Lamprobacter sp.]|uniref:hypothetical protein n=1 Tax=Lamprobacter sp. TaxID=3100796 RepID=UPI002B25DD3E|nr:hypothetical protein [Lamprobacter sp.]MEA3639683.1 hypothetical protein [Lamprobacter sp.]